MKIVKPLGLSLLMLGFVTSAYAVREGMYVGTALGMTNTNNKTATTQTGFLSPPTVETNAKSTGVGGRFFFGYNFNPFIAAEMGYTHYAYTKYNVSPFAGQNTPGIQENAIDIVGKILYNVGPTGLGVFGKAGAAYFRYTKSGALLPLGQGGSGTTSKLLPTAGLGASYELTQNWVADFSMTRVFGTSTVPSASLYALGFAYHWVDKYCGQFLC